MEAILNLILRFGFISRKQFRALLDNPPGNRAELLQALVQREWISPRDREELEPLLDSLEAISEGPPESADSAMQEVHATAARVAQSDSNVLILGESGVGKSRLARWIHNHSMRNKGPFVVVSCGSIPENLLESELFGVEKGAYTGASRSREGRFQKAGGGTLFLDEIGELPLNLQVKLLRAIQEKKVEPLGSGREVYVNVRLIAATNRNLEEDVRQKRFREDLYFRLNVVPMLLPSLRDRKEDIPLLFDFFLKEFEKKYGRIFVLEDPALPRKLMAYPWPGNIRELENCLERLCVLSEDGQLRARDLPAGIQKALSGAEKGPRLFAKEDRPPTMPEGREMSEIRSSLQGAFEKKRGLPSIAEAEEFLIRRALETAGSIGGAAELLDVHRNTIRNKIKQYGIDRRTLEKG
ncbi:MAG: sigma-54-dependent Fis family transcriptional regulator [Leptospiraceae bacterium]|nr:sigma-54-dependent Fis family transcriptional regulator [Leptospiraceae bacterium]MCB1169259.1 sigma-54-dependent Fis family transcriptional regulator [Leptospiraceae bacterium]